ncbi:MAG TPA: glycosyltransferase family 2 protein, partial [Gemmataceae bacterium]|nr:glycosyltransferase family 2 protein [Gemmataceae bacterium]
PRLRGADGAVQASCRPRPTLAALLHRNTLLRGTGLLRRAYRRFRERALVPDEPQRVDVLMGAAMFLRREVFFECGPWDEDYTFGGEDLQLSTAVGERYEVVYLPTVEVTHFGRASSRRHVRYVAAHIPVGFLKYLRKSGCSRPALWLYKAAVSLDAPVQCLGKGAEYLWRRLRGRREAAAKSLLACRGFWHFLTDGLGPFWRA